MPLARTQEERDIERRCKAWAFKISGQEVYVLFDKLSHRTLAKIWPGIVRVGSHGMRSFQRNPVVFDLDKIKAGKHDIEEIIIHECCHILHPHHGPAFQAEMKKWLGRFEWEKPETSYTAGMATLSIDGVAVAKVSEIKITMNGGEENGKVHT